MSAITARRLALGALIAGAVGVLFLVLGGSDSGHRVSAVAPSAANLLPGQEINAAGHKVGSVTSVEPVDGGRSARINMRIDDEDYWPLPRDSKLEARFGGTVSFSSRYLLLTRGKDRGHLIDEGGELLRANVKVPVEVDEFISIFNRSVRRDFKRFIENGAPVFESGGPDLNRALGKSTPVVEGASGVFEDLTKNQRRLETLVASTGSVVDAIDRSSPDTRVLLTGAAQTFDAIASEADDLQVTLDQFPAALRQTRSTLARADATLRDVGVLTDRIGPGVEQLRLTATPLTRVLAGLREVAPDLRATLRTARTSAPDITRLLDRVRTVSPQLGSIFRQGTTELGCVRPYAPEIAALGTTWGDWISPVDSRDHYLRATVQNYLPAQYNNVPITPAEAARIYSGLKYGMPRPPGETSGQPWYQPECGAGPEALDPAQDQEAQTLGRAVPPPELRNVASLKGGKR